jgi:hypothetical protein
VAVPKRFFGKTWLMPDDAEPKAKKGFWPLVFCLSLNLPLLLGGLARPSPACLLALNPGASSDSSPQFYCFLIGIPLAVVSALCSGL